MNGVLPTVPSIVGLKPGDIASVLPALPQLGQWAFRFGGTKEQPLYQPNMGIVSELRSKLATGAITFDEAAATIKGSAPTGQIQHGLNPEELKQSLVRSFGGQSFVGPEGQKGKFNVKSYGFIPETTKLVKSVVTGMGPSTEMRALPQGYGKIL